VKSHSYRHGEPLYILKTVKEVIELGETGPGSLIQLLWTKVLDSKSNNSVLKPNICIILSIYIDLPGMSFSLAFPSMPNPKHILQCLRVILE